MLLFVLGLLVLVFSVSGMVSVMLLFVRVMCIAYCVLIID